MKVRYLVLMNLDFTENKISKVSDLVKKVEYDAVISDIEKKKILLLLIKINF